MTKTKAQQIMAATEVRAADDVTAAIQDIAAEFEPYIIKQRRHFHKHPELSLAEERTTSDIANQLDAMNIPYERPLKTGLVATLRGRHPARDREAAPPGPSWGGARRGNSWRRAGWRCRKLCAPRQGAAPGGYGSGGAA